MYGTYVFYTRSLYPNISFTMSERKKVKGEETTTVVTVVDATIKDEPWYPLENDPTVVNSLLDRMGFDTSLYRFTNVLTTEPWAISIIIQPVFAVMMLYQKTDVQ